MIKNIKTSENIKGLLKNETGITMIALIFTIIVLIIIATISIKGGMHSREDSKDQVQKAELQIVQHAILEKYTKAQLTKEELPGTKITYNDASEVIEEINNETGSEIVLQGTDYYRLNKNDLNNLGIENSEDTYIVNYETGEVLNESKISTSSGEALYTYARTAE